MEYLNDGYIISGFTTFKSTYECMVNTYKDIFDENNMTNAKSIIRKNTDGYLLSFGVGLTGKRKTFNGEKYQTKISKSLGELNTFAQEAIGNVPVFVDSGGFQAATGYLPVKLFPEYLKAYHNWLSERRDLYTYAFSLDIPPADKAINDFNDIKRMNRESFLDMKNLPIESQQKTIPVYHPDDPTTNEFFYDLFFKKEKIFYELNTDNWAIGGLVGARKSDNHNIYFNYAFGIYNLVRHQMLKGKNFINMHILGVASFQSMLFFILLRKLLKKIHNFDIRITYDSTSTIKKIQLGRYIHTFTDLSIYSKDLKDINLDDVYNNILLKLQFFKRDLNVKVIHTKLTRHEFVVEFVKTLIAKYGVKYDGVKLYNEKDSYEDLSEYVLLTGDLVNYKIINKMCDLVSDNLLNKFYNGENITSDCMKLITNWNGGKISKKQVIMAQRYHNTLRLFMNLTDEHKTNKLVDEYLHYDEISTFKNSANGIKKLVF